MIICDLDQLWPGRPRFELVLVSSTTVFFVSEFVSVFVILMNLGQDRPDLNLYCFILYWFQYCLNFVIYAARSEQYRCKKTTIMVKKSCKGPQNVECTVTSHAAFNIFDTYKDKNALLKHRNAYIRYLRKHLHCLFSRYERLTKLVQIISRPARRRQNTIFVIHTSMDGVPRCLNALLISRGGPENARFKKALGSQTKCWI